MAIRLQRRKKESKEEFIQRVYDTFEKGKASNKEQDDRADSYFEKWYSDSLKDNESTDGPLQFIGDWMEKASQSLGIESTKDRVGDMVESVSGLFRQEVELKLNDVSELKTEDAIKLRDEYGLKK